MRYLQKYETVIHDDYDQEKKVGDLVRLSKGFLKKPSILWSTIGVNVWSDRIFIIKDINKNSRDWRYEVHFFEDDKFYAWLKHKDMVKLSKEEVEEFLMKRDAKKYNL